MMIGYNNNCDVPWFEINGFSTCNNTYDVMHFLSAYNDALIRYPSNCSCIRPCKRTKYVITNSYKTDVVYNQYILTGDAPTAISIHVESNVVEHIEETLTYDTSQLISDVGGSIGFLLGMSVLRFVNFVLNFIEAS